jgi:hypothetical protein
MESNEQYFVTREISKLVKRFSSERTFDSNRKVRSITPEMLVIEERQRLLILTTKCFKEDSESKRIEGKIK